MPSKRTSQLLIAVLLVGITSSTTNGDDVDVWIGTTTPRGGDSKGIYHATLHVDTGELRPPRLAAEMDSPGFLALHPNEKVLYSTGQVSGVPSVVAYRIEQHDSGPQLEFLNSQPTGDGGAAHLATDRSGSALLSAQYGGGSTALYPIADDGSIGAQTDLIEHGSPSRVVASRQEAPHPHWVGTSPDNQFAFVPDLGMDRVIIYRLDPEQPGLAWHGEGIVPPGSGPRHMKFHPNGEHIYVLNELELTVTTFAYDSRAGTMESIQTIPTVPTLEKQKETSVSASEIRVHPSGQFVYAANRGHDTITAFAIEAETGFLRELEREPIRGGWPRNFNIDPSGKWLLAAGRDSNTLAVFKIDPGSGELTYIRQMISVPTPICVLFGSR